MDAEGTFVRVSLRMNKSGVIRTCGYAGFTAAALVMVDKHHSAAFMDVAGAAGTAIDARRIVAVVAALGTDFHVKVWVGPGRGVCQPVPVMSFGHLVLGLAGDDAIHAPDAFHRV
jgi:hypothetical protein